MPIASLAIHPGVSIVFEGLDQTGKSTQLEFLRESINPESVIFAHMPSGFVPFTQRIYDALESDTEKPKSGLAQQLAHLACHAESIEQLVGATYSKALVLDRWWWSTLAYGWYGGSVEKSGLSEQSFRDLINAIWSPVTPSIIFVFLEAHHFDMNNSPGVESGYRTLVNQYSDHAVVVPSATKETTHDFLVRSLIQRGLAHRA